MDKISNLLLIWSVCLTLTWCWSKSLEVNTEVNNVKLNVDKALLDNKLLVIWKSINIIWNNDFLFFINYYNIDNEKTFEMKVMEIQSKNWLKVDWIIWNNTLKVIYLNIYSKESSSNLNQDVITRLNIYNEMEWYKSHPWKNSKFWKLYPSKVPDIFDKNYYYWIWLWENIKGWFINKELSWLFYESIDFKWNISMLQKVNWKFAVALYVDWTLKLLSYTSPWNPNITWWIKTKLWVFTSEREDKYYISWAKSSISRSWNRLTWAIMPYSVHVQKWVHVHA